MLKIACCDDSPEDAVGLCAALDSYLSHNEREHVLVSSFDNALICAEEIDRMGGVDVILLDICMPGLLGTDIAREVRKRNDKTEIIFVTSSDEFAVEAFTLKAAHYLVKPFSQNDFDEAMNVALGRCSSKEVKRIVLKTRGRSLVSLDVGEIAYIESASHSQNLHTDKGERIEVRQSLKEVFSLLGDISPGQFFMPYKGYIINIDTIRIIENAQVVLRDGTVVPATPANVRTLKEHYFNYFFPDDGATWKP